METDNEPRGVDPHQFRRVMGRFATGVTVITATTNGETRGMTANAFMSGSLDPPLCVVSIAKRAHMHTFLRKSDRFGINILAEGQERIADHFAGRTIAGLHVPFARVDGIPVLAESAARILATTVASHDCGDHTLFIGHISAMTTDDRPPLIYHAARFGAFEPHGTRGSVPEIW
jgi:flavin reductase